jgi:GNAT superfamily N-acetyltransferase
MGQALREWASTPSMVHRVSPQSWVFLAGAPTPDVNLALVHDDDPHTLVGVLETIAEVGCPTLLMLAGPATTCAGSLGPTWVSAGSMPFMQADIATTPCRRDPRVRRAGSADFDAVSAMLGDAFAMTAQVAAVPLHPVHDPDAEMTTWLLEDHDEPVSTVMSCRVGDAVTVWCMATPQRFTRHGYARALLADLMARADADGVKVGLLGATPAGKPLYDATGWTTLEAWDLYTNGETTNFH